MEKQFIELPADEVKLSFAAFCVEGTARRLGRPYKEIFERMKNVGMIEKYIIPYYDVLHTESREYVIEDVIECLNTWEAKK